MTFTEWHTSHITALARFKHSYSETPENIRKSNYWNPYTYIYMYTYRYTYTFICIYILYIYNYIHIDSYIYMPLRKNKETQAASNILHAPSYPQCLDSKSLAELRRFLPREPTTFIFRGYNPYIGGWKPSFFMVLGSKGNYLKFR